MGDSNILDDIDIKIMDGENEQTGRNSEVTEMADTDLNSTYSRRERESNLVELLKSDSQGSDNSRSGREVVAMDSTADATVITVGNGTKAGRIIRKAAMAAGISILAVTASVFEAENVDGFLANAEVAMESVLDSEHAHVTDESNLDLVLAMGTQGSEPIQTAKHLEVKKSSLDNKDQSLSSTDVGVEIGGEPPEPPGSLATEALETPLDVLNAEPGDFFMAEKNSQDPFEISGNIKFESALHMSHSDKIAFVDEFTRKTDSIQNIISNFHGKVNTASFLDEIHGPSDSEAKYSALKLFQFINSTYQLAQLQVQGFPEVDEPLSEAKDFLLSSYVEESVEFMVNESSVNHRVLKSLYEINFMLDTVDLDSESKDGMNMR